MNSRISLSGTEPTDSQSAEIAFKLASLWLARGKTEQAIAGYRKVLAISPDHQQAALHLDYLLRQQQYPQSTQSNPQGNPQGKISLLYQKSFASHRCGWNFAIHALQPLHNRDGILFDGYLESSFLWKDRPPGKVQVPYTQPWVGFLHSPPNIPKWFYYKDSPQALFALPAWKESLKYCVGLFCLSQYHAQWLRQHTHQTISALIHPTEIPAAQFDFDKFVSNPRKKIVQLGWWLRKLTAIYQLPIAASTATSNLLGYEKIKLNPAFATDAEKQIKALELKELAAESVILDPELLYNTREMSHISNNEYDMLLTCNIAFIALHDSSANNAVIECIARATPLLINPLPAVVEYLGKDYPMYFYTLSEAAQKAQDLDLIKLTHEYLKGCETRQKLSADYFCTSFKNSAVYQKIEG